MLLEQHPTVGPTLTAQLRRVTACPHLVIWFIPDIVQVEFIAAYHVIACATPRN